MDVGAPFVSQSKAPEAVQPSERPLDAPPEDAEAAPVRAARFATTALMPWTRRRA
jgi:hypothetical protein